MIWSILIKLTMLLLFHSCKEREYLDLNNNLKMDIHENHELPSLERAQYRKNEQNSEINDVRVEASLVRALNRLRVSKR